MALNIKKNNKKEEVNCMAITEIQVKRAKVFESGDISFDAVVNGVTIYGMMYKHWKNGAFISFPSRKGSNGKYYNYCYFKVSEDNMESIEDQITNLLG